MEQRVEPKKPIQFDQAKFNETIGRVAQYLVQKTMREGRRHDQNFQTVIGGVSFWFEIAYDDKGDVVPNQDYLLSFGTTPDMWDFKAIINVIEEQERRWLIQSGVPIGGITPY